LDGTINPKKDSSFHAKISLCSQSAGFTRREASKLKI